MEAGKKDFHLWAAALDTVVLAVEEFLHFLTVRAPFGALDVLNENLHLLSGLKAMHSGHSDGIICHNK